MKKNRLLNQEGQSLVGTLVSMAIIAVVIASLASIFKKYSAEMRAMNENLTVLQLQKDLSTKLSDGSVCTFQLTNHGAWHAGATPPLTFDASVLGSEDSPTISLNQILANASPGAPVLASVNKPIDLNTNSVVIKSIQITNIIGPATGNTFSAKFQVSFDSLKWARPLDPISIRTTLLTKGVGNIKTITGCLGEDFR